MKPKNRFSAAAPYLTAGLATVVFMLVIYAINGIFPFGSGSVVCDDMVQQTISNYTYFWDYLRSGGKLSLMFNWETAAGAQILTTGFYILKPWEIIFSLLVPRDGIVNGIAILLIFKITCATLSMLLFLRKKFTIAPYWQVLLSLTYSLSSFILIYYTNMGWIDAAFMFPIIILAGLYMTDTGKWWPYVLILTYALTLSLYIAYMIFMFLLLVGGLYMIFMQDKTTRKTAILRFGITSVLSLLMSGVITVPTVFYMFRSTRYSLKTTEGSAGSLMKIITATNNYPEIKYALIFACSALLWAVMIMLTVNIFENKKKCAFYLCSTAILILPVLFENLNLIWHVGSYVSFPLRYLYMLSFILICAAAYAIQSGFVFNMSGKVKTAVCIAVSAATGIAGTVLMYSKVYLHTDAVEGLTYKYIFQKDSELFLLGAFFCFLFAYFFALSITNKKVSCAIASVFMIAEAGMCADVSIGTNSGREGVLPMYSLDFVDRAEQCAEDLPLENDNLTRIKDQDTFLNSNYPMFFRYPAMSNFTHLVSEDMTTSMKALGYSQVYTRVLDTSGTILSDMLLNIKYTFTQKKLDEEEFDYMGRLGECELYEYRYQLPVGLLVHDDFVNTDIIGIKDPFESTNRLFNTLGGTGTLIKTDSQIFDIDECGGACIYEKHIDGKQHVYVKIDTSKGEDIDNGSLQIGLNGTTLDLSYFGSDLNYRYPNNFNNGLLDLGIFEDEDILISVGVWRDVGKKLTVTLGEADYSKLAEVCEKNSDKHAEVSTEAKSLSAKVTVNDDNTYLFLPVNDDPGWSCTVNGNKAELGYALGSFLTVRLEKGENDVQLEFLPYGLKPGAVISVVSTALFIVLLIIKKYRSIPDDSSNAFLKVFEKVYTAGMIVIYAVMYGSCIICSIYFNYIR